MADDLEVKPGLVIPGHELDESTSRSGGPGGQHVNKVSSKVTLRWSVAKTSALSETQRFRVTEKLGPRLTNDGDLIVNADDSRSQLMNREIARERLAEIVRDALKVQRARVPTKPGKGAERRRIDAKKKKGATKAGRGRVRDE